MFSWRVTKYDPDKRDEMGAYLDKAEWISVSDIGGSISEEEYLETERKYINAITSFMDERGLTKLYLTNLEIHSDEVRKQQATSFIASLWLGKSVTVEEIRELAKLTLRGAIWCKLSYKKEFFVHFGYDYYMYIGGVVDCPIARKKVGESGLFVEDFVSPY